MATAFFKNLQQNKLYCGVAILDSLFQLLRFRQCFVKIVSVWEYDYLQYSWASFQHCSTVTATSGVSATDNFVSKVSYRVIAFYNNCHDFILSVLQLERAKSYQVFYFVNLIVKCPQQHHLF